MPTPQRWAQFLGSAGLITGLGVLFVKFGTPDDDQFLRELSPELKAKYMKEKRVREKADEMLRQKVEETKENPAWLNGSGAMRKLDFEIAERARKSVEADEHSAYMDAERLRLRELAQKEKKL